MEEIWDQLVAYRIKHREVSIKELFKSDSGRFSAFSCSLEDMLFDYSKTSIDKESLKLLLCLAEESTLQQRRDAMFSGERINTTEQRSVLHTALRNRSSNPVYVAGRDVMPGINSTLAKMASFAEGIRAGDIHSASGSTFTDVVNIGIGGSDLGPSMSTLALAPFHDGPRTHFVSNVDGAHITDTLKDLNPARTLIVVASKTFTTIETMTNARTALRWMRKELGEYAGSHFVALSSAHDRTDEFGIPSDRVFGFEDWVGGRYSVWGPIGLSLMLAIGSEKFSEFLQGAFEMDNHFRTTPFEHNMPVLLGLVGVWHHNICDYSSRAVLPYDQRLSRFSAYLQQLDMESNGKRVDLNGMGLQRFSGPIVWGEPGTNGQHAFYQLIHQGTEVVPCEFLVAANGFEANLSEHHELLLSNCLAQSEALMCGRSLEDVRLLLAEQGIEDPDGNLVAHRVFPGNRPSTTLVYRKLTPSTLGRLIALYEHRVFVEGCLWNINSFDQWGVELGKQLASELLPLIKAGDGSQSKDGSTAGLLRTLDLLRRDVTV